MSIDKVNPYYPVLNRNFNFDHDELSGVELAARIADTLNQVIDIVNGWTNTLAGYELSTNITINRLLSPSGNFTGSLLGRAVSMVLAEMDDNADKIKYIANQFSDGQTGLVIDGGFFADSGIDKNFDGGIF